MAGEQTAGRGRLQRHWLSPRNAGLYFSIIVRPKFSQSLWPLLTLMSAVAAHEALLDACGLETDIKWPNDLMVNDKKLCGILAETVETPQGRAVVIGIGINLTTNSFPPELETVATSVAAASKQTPDLEVVLNALVLSLVGYYQVLQNPDGAEAITREWSKRSSYSEGRQIRVSCGDETFEGTTRGIESDGALRVETSDGEIKTVRAGDVTAVRSRL